MKNFKPIYLTVLQRCESCDRIKRIGAQVFGAFERDHTGTDLTIVCDEFCLADLRARENRKTAASFIERRGMQIN